MLGFTPDIHQLMEIRRSTPLQHTVRAGHPSGNTDT
jgi:hypothetical protein